MHEGHRSRLISKVKNPSSLQEHELLEILLFNACPRKDLNATAHAILNSFGSLSGVFSSSEQSLLQVEGVGQSMAEYLVCLGKCLALLEDGKSFAQVNTTCAFKRFLSERIQRTDLNGLEIYCLDIDGRIRRARTVSASKDNFQKQAFEQVLAILSVYKPYGVYAANLRSGKSVQPETADDDSVVLLAKACALNGVKFYDYCIACRDGGDIFSYFVADRLASAFSYGAN